MFDTERFIYEIEKQPAIYDVKSKEYSMKDVKAKCWSKVAAVMIEDWADFDRNTKQEKLKELMKKWKAIRDCYVRDHRLAMAAEAGSAPKKRKYIFYDKLHFLMPHVKCSPNLNISPSEYHDDSCEEAQMDDIHVKEEPDDGFHASSPDLSNSSTSQAQIRPKDKETAHEIRILDNSSEDLRASGLEWQKEERNLDKNGHRAFLLSFAPVLDTMPLSSSMLLRSQISQLFSNHFAQNENHSGTSTE